VVHIVPFYLAIAFALLLVKLATPLSISPTEARTAIAAVGGWALIVLAVPRLLIANQLDPNAATVAFLALVALVVAVVAYAAVRHGRGAKRVAFVQARSAHE
jgi:hypothetical protein